VPFVLGGRPRAHKQTPIPAVPFTSQSHFISLTIICSNRLRWFQLLPYLEGVCWRGFACRGRV